jgi:hypothetical protein
VRIAFYDHGFYHQSAAIPDLPAPEDTWGVYGAKAHLHSRVNVVGMEMWRIPLLHRLLDDGHELLWLTRRKVDPSPELDEDLARLVETYPEYERFVRPVDPCLNPDSFLTWPVRTYLNQHYFDDQNLFLDTTNPSTEMLRYWVREQVLGVVPDADIFVCAVMRADEATAFEVSYFTGVYLERGVPIVLWDQDHQLSGSVAMFKRLGHDWPNPLVTVIGPYEEPTSYASPITIDYPYVDVFEREPLPVAERIGGVYVGNDYGRREAMERLLLSLSDTLPITVWGRYEAKDGPEWCARFPHVNWAGRIPSNQVPGAVARGHFTVNMVKADYMSIGLLTLRTFDANVYGTLQIADARIKRIEKYVPPQFIVSNTAEATRIAKRIMELTDEQYGEQLERQRELTRRNDMDAFTTRFYEILDEAMGDREPRDDLPALSAIEPPRQLKPGQLCKKNDVRVPLGEYAGVGWSPRWKADKAAAMASALEDDGSVE